MIIFPGPDAAKTSNAIINIDGILLGLNIDGVKWRYNHFDGWGMGAGVETNFASRPSQHGSFDAPAYRRARIVTLGGDIVAQTRGAAKLAERQLAALLADGTLGTIAVDDPDLGLEQAQVRLSDTPQSDGSSAGVGIVHWQLQFTAPDHRKYGNAIALSTGLPGGGTGLSWPIGSFFNFGDPGSLGQVTVTNDGTAPTEPQFTVSGPLSVGFQITEAETSRRLRYASPVSSDVAIDCGEGTVTSGGQDREGLLTVDEFFSIPAGASRTYQFSTLGAESADNPPRMSVTVSPAYH